MQLAPLLAEAAAHWWQNGVLYIVIALLTPFVIPVAYLLVGRLHDRSAAEPEPSELPHAGTSV